MDCAAAGYWCAERARQSALRALPPSPQRDAAAAWSEEEASWAARAAREGAEWAAREGAEASWAASWAAAAAREGAAAELLAIAEYVRNHYALPSKEVG